MAQATCRAQCGLTFSGMTAFDAHQKSVGDDRGSVRCLPPAAVSLVERNGVYGFPAPDEPIKYGAAQAEAKVYTCARCGNEFEKRPGRGRPPRNCYDCQEA